MSPDDAPREHFSSVTDPPWSIVAGDRVLATGRTGIDAWRAVLAAGEAERDALRARAEGAEAALAAARAEADRLREVAKHTLSRAHVAEAALATARAEGAAAERAAIDARLREHREAAARIEGQCAYAGPDPSAAQCAWMWPDRPVEGA